MADKVKTKKVEDRISMSYNRSDLKTAGFDVDDNSKLRRAIKEKLNLPAPMSRVEKLEVLKKKHGLIAKTPQGILKELEEKELI